MGKPTLIMVHGLVGSLHYFDPQARMPGVTVVADDLLGYGRYAHSPADRLTLAAQADHVVQWIDATGPGPIWLLGHSMGGAVAVLVADRRPDRIRGLINVEGNLTEKDTFWSRKIAARTREQWAREYDEMLADPSGWLARCGVEPDPQRAAWARHLLENQPAATVHAMAMALVKETLRRDYLDTVRRLLDRGIPMHLLAGEKSAADWGVPAFVRRGAASYTEQPGTGHLMMLEAADEFCRLVAAMIDGSINQGA